MYYITKRDGRVKEYNRRKIENAIAAAFTDVDGCVDDYAEAKITSITDYVEEKIKASDHPLGVEEIQDLVENGLMNTKRKDVARSYITYRNERTRLREGNSEFIKEVGEKLTASNVQNQNANVDERSFGGRMGEARNVLTKKYALDYLISPKARKNHEENRIYIHDLDNYASGCHNCLTIPFDPLLRNGFNTRQTDVRGANSVNTAFQLVAVIFQLQSLQQFGGVSASHLDHTMVPYVRLSFFKHYCDGVEFIYDNEKAALEFKDRFSREEIMDNLSIESSFYQNSNYFKAYKYALKKTTKETEQAVEGMYHNLNTLQSRSGNQLPFTSINYGTCTLPEGRMVIKALLEGSIKGVGKLHRTSIFPCGIFQCMRGVNRKPGDPNYDMFKLAIKSTAKRLYPNYCNVDWSTNAGYDRNDPRTYVSTMGCRTYNGSDINGLGQLKDGRGNIAPSTIIMPTLAMEAKEEAELKGTNIVDEFMKILDTAIDDCREGLIDRFEYICSQPMESAKFMYENGLMAGYVPEEGIRSALKHGTLAIGNVGLAETLQILVGCDQTEEKGFELACKIYQLFKDKCKYFKEHDKLNWGVYNTPAENLVYTAMTKFKKKYGVIPNVSENMYFTNSIHCPVWKELSPFEKIDIEAKLGNYSNAGDILYIELDSDALHNLDAIETYINYAMDHDVPYFAINIPNDTCLDCGFTGEFNDKCPVCGSEKIQQLRRVTGYLTGNYKTAFNKGKQQEVEMRYQHTKKLRGINITEFTKETINELKEAQ